MNDYDFHKDSLKPTKAYNNIISPKHNNKQKATTERSKSKEKMIITSFSKKQVTEMNSKKSPLSINATSQKKLSTLESPGFKKSPCQSEYYFKTAETKT